MLDEHGQYAEQAAVGPILLLLIITMSLHETRCAAGYLLAIEMPCTQRMFSNFAIALLLVDDFVSHPCCEISMDGKWT